MRSRRRAAVSLAAIALTLVAARAASQSLPVLTAPVNDFAQVLGSDVSATLDRRIRALQAASGDVVVVATVKTFAPYGSIEEYAVRLFEKAGIGEKDKHNGALVVLALNERRVRIEVGYGLEEFITDGFAGETIREFMLPAFRQGDYGGGLLAGTTRIIRRIADARGVALQDVPRAGRDTKPKGGIPIGLLFLLARRSCRRRAPSPAAPPGDAAAGTAGRGAAGAAARPVRRGLDRRRARRVRWRRRRQAVDLAASAAARAAAAGRRGAGEQRCRAMTASSFFRGRGAPPPRPYARLRARLALCARASLRSAGCR